MYHRYNRIKNSIPGVLFYNNLNGSFVYVIYNKSIDKFPKSFPKSWGNSENFR